MSEPAARKRPGWLDRVERAGNALPDPTTLFVLGALLVLVGAELAVQLDWSVEKTVTQVGTGPAGEPVQERVQVEVRPTRLLSGDGIFWILKTLVTNFTGFPPLGVVLVGMLGIGVAERSGFIGALLKGLLLAVPDRLLTPTVFFVGVMSSMGLDAGYVVLPPVAAALYQAVGRSPLVGLGAVFAGVSAGFSANLFITSLDPLLSELSTSSAQLLDPAYVVTADANWWFMIASTVLLTGVGWAVTAWWVEPRMARREAASDGAADTPAAPDDAMAGPLTAPERRGLVFAVGAAAAATGLFALASVLPGWPLHGDDGPFPRWVRVIVPLLFLVFLLPGVVYGAVTGRIRNDKDVASMMGETMASMGSYLVLAFFAGQFIAWFAYTGLGEMLAISGGRALAAARLPPALLMVGFIGVVAVGNLFIGSMSAKYAFFAPVFVPMFMQTGIAPELTQAAYRVGDSVSNVITPLNPYVVILLAFMQRYAKDAGIGTLVALMLPYALVFGVIWSALLVAWVVLGVPLGPHGALVYTP
ncbi:MAG: AbgT family transporter [Myxococcota bacterium]